jgi:hypothetical protein
VGIRGVEGQISRLEDQGERHARFWPFRSASASFAVCFAWADSEVKEAVRHGADRDPDFVTACALPYRTREDLDFLLRNLAHGTKAAWAVMIQVYLNRRIFGAHDAAGAFVSYFGHLPTPECLEALWLTIRPENGNNRWLTQVDEMDSLTQSEIQASSKFLYSLVYPKAKEIRKQFGFVKHDPQNEPITCIGRRDRDRLRIDARTHQVRMQQLSLDDGETEAMVSRIVNPIEEAFQRASDRQRIEALIEEADLSERQLNAIIALAEMGNQADAIRLTGDRSAVDNAVKKLKKAAEAIS